MDERRTGWVLIVVLVLALMRDAVEVYRDPVKAGAKLYVRV